MQLGIDVLLKDKALLGKLTGKRIALLGNPASMTGDFRHSIDALSQIHSLTLTAAFGPQHGMRGEKQDNMIETEDYIDPIYKIPVFSLYGQVRKPTPKMMDTFDIILFDLQDVGTRIYTFLTTLFYLLEACALFKKEIWILDRPNPAGRPVEGSYLLAPEWLSFVGGAKVPMRHGMTLGEIAQWYVKSQNLDVHFQVIEMEGYHPLVGPGFGWPLGELPWVNPSPNAASLSMARCFSGTVLLEGTQLSEGRGTTRPLEMVGAPDLDFYLVLKKMEQLKSDWMRGCRLRPFYFQPTFQKHSGKICSGFQIHVDDHHYQHDTFKPYRLISLCLKAIRILQRDYPIWRDFHYEYERDRLAIDLINGSPLLRSWVDDPQGMPEDLEKILESDEKDWKEKQREFLIYF